MAKLKIINLEQKKKISCFGKRKYETSKQAQDCYNSNNYKKNTSRQYLFRDIITIYECPFCNNWHIGHLKNGGYKNGINR